MLSLGVLVHFQQSEAKNFQIILENIFADLFHALMQFSFSKRETKLGYYHKKCKNTSCLTSCRMTQKTLEKSLKCLEPKPSIQPAPQKQILTDVLENCKATAGTTSQKKPILLNFVLLSEVFSPRFSNKTDFFLGCLRRLGSYINRRF